MQFQWLMSSFCHQTKVVTNDHLILTIHYSNKSINVDYMVLNKSGYKGNILASFYNSQKDLRGYILFEIDLAREDLFEHHKFKSNDKLISSSSEGHL